MPRYQRVYDNRRDPSSASGPALNRILQGGPLLAELMVPEVRRLLEVALPLLYRSRELLRLVCFGGVPNAAQATEAHWLVFAPAGCHSPGMMPQPEDPARSRQGPGEVAAAMRTT